MADNTQVIKAESTPYTGGDIIATDDVGGIKFQRAKIALGSDGIHDGDVSATNPMPVLLNQFDAASTMRDAFGRVRISQPQVLGFGSFEYGVNAQFIETSLAGTGSVTNSLNESAILLNTGGTASGALAYAATRKFHRYVPGRSQLIRFTGCFATPQANLRQRAGYFGNRNGFFIEIDGLDIYFVRRSYTSGSVVDTRIARSSWQDPMDGSGASGINLNLAGGLSWLAWIDMEWLGVGRYRFGFANPTTGELTTAYEASGTNVLTVPYIGTANLPVRYEIQNTGTTASSSSLKWICYAVDTEGGDEGRISEQFSYANAFPQTLTTITLRPLVALRAATTGPNSAPNRGQIVLVNVSAMVTGNASAFFWVILNPTTLTQNGGAVSWNTAAKISEFATFANAGLDAWTGGSIVDSFFVPASNQSKGTSDIDIYRRLPLVYTELNSVQDTIVLVGGTISGTTTAVGSMTWQEIL